jgi:hypothetical protein
MVSIENFGYAVAFRSLFVLIAAAYKAKKKAQCQETTKNFKDHKDGFLARMLK